MALGTLAFYFGIAVFTASFKPVLAVLIFAICLLAYNKFIEEKELSARFGEEYARYKESTPFLVPRIRARRSPK